MKGGSAVAETPKSPPKEGEAATVAAPKASAATRNTGRKSTILTSDSNSLDNRIKALLGG